MQLSYVFIVNTIAALLYGISSVAAPATILDMHGLTTGPTEILLGRFFGVALIGIGLITWFVRDSTDKSVTDGVTLALLLSDIVGFVVALLAMLAGTMSTIGWVAVALYALLVLGYGYFRFFK